MSPIDFIVVITITLVTAVAIQLLLFKFFTDGLVKELEENEEINKERLSVLEKIIKEQC